MQRNSLFNAQTRAVMIFRTSESAVLAAFLSKLERGGGGGRVLCLYF